MMTDEGTTQRTDLSDLVRKRRLELGMSYRGLAEACIDPEDPEAGPLWGRSTLENLEKGVGIKAPTLPQLRALKAGLRVPLGLVQEATGAQFVGIDTVWSHDGKIRTLVHGFRELDEADQERVLAMMESWRRLRRD
ncbi:XRE family transcriptional regulator [Streptomyces sp. NPDC006458]|uniref:XRE family transcriptional regulator n=1 Tax=Streptomyces sp. NPDC006458 TaxID=3154302 RepID=UPI0033B1152A